MFFSLFLYARNGSRMKWNERDAQSYRRNEQYLCINGHAMLPLLDDGNAVLSRVFFFLSSSFFIGSSEVRDSLILLLCVYVFFLLVCRSFGRCFWFFNLARFFLVTATLVKCGKSCRTQPAFFKQMFKKNCIAK